MADYLYRIKSQIMNTNVRNNKNTKLLFPDNLLIGKTKYFKRNPIE